MTRDNLPAVTVLGLGPMGQALAGAFRRASHPTTVWNRTTSKADSLVAQGAQRADTPAEAVAGSDLVVVCVLDYAAAQAVVEPAAAVLKGRTLLNLTADTPHRVRRMADWAADHGIDYLDGAIMTPTTTIGGPHAVFLYSGPTDLYETHRPTLASLGGTATYLGAAPDRAAAHDVALLDIYWTAMAGVAHAFALARAEGIAAADFGRLARGIGDLLPESIDEHAKRLAADDHTADVSNISSAAAGMAHVAEASRAHGIDAALIGAAHALARRAIDAGHGADDFSRMTLTLEDR